jgi:hypothetical protein
MPEKPKESLVCSYIKVLYVSLQLTERYRIKLKLWRIRKINCRMAKLENFEQKIPRLGKVLVSLFLGSFVMIYS